MIRVAIAISMSSNPGIAVVAACPLTRTPTVRLCHIDAEVTNFHAYWFAMDLALSRLDGRPAEILTNCTGFLDDRGRMRPAWSEEYRALSETCVRRARASGSVVRFVGTAPSAPKTPEADWIRWLGQRARQELAQWLEAPPYEGDAL